MILWTRAAVGRGVRDAAIPAPMPGCISKKGAAKVTMLTIIAGPKVGLRTHAIPQILINKQAKAIPIR